MVGGGDNGVKTGCLDLVVECGFQVVRIRMLWTTSTISY